MLTAAFKALVLGAVLSSPVVGMAQTAPPGVSAPQMARLSDLLKISDLMAVVRQEGLANTDEMDGDLLGGTGGVAWAAAVSKVYDSERMRGLFDARFAEVLRNDVETQAAMLAFFETPLGNKVLQLEIDARRSLLEPDIEEAAGAVWAQAQVDDLPRVSQLERLVEVSELVETNVMGALNANLAFYKGLTAGGAFDPPMTESDMLSAVWQQEGDIRKETADWLFPYLFMAYQPLSDAEMEAYVAFSTSAAGKRANAALFAGFDAVFVALSQDLGLAAAAMMGGDAI